jgi:hypothetical protein
MKKITPSIIIVVLFISTVIYFNSNKSEISDWKISTDNKNHISFQYPEKLATEYIHEMDWPPQFQITDKPFACKESGSEITELGRTTKEEVNGRLYCITRSNQGAAGSIYTKHTYGFERANATALLTFTTRAVQCANYDDPQKTACEKERASFNIDEITDKMVGSLKSI